jgi:hypothetical protein
MEQNLGPVRSAWFACTVGTAVGLIAYDIETLLIPVRLDYFGPLMLIAAAVLGGAATIVYAQSRMKWLPCFVVALAMTSHFYHPVIGRPLLQTFLIYGVTILGAFIAALLGHRWSRVLRKKEPAGSLVPAGK